MEDYDAKIAVAMEFYAVRGDLRPFDESQNKLTGKSRQGDARLCTRPLRYATRPLPGPRAGSRLAGLLVSYRTLAVLAGCGQN